MMTLMERDADTESTWHAEGLRLDLIEPMKRWSVKYEGDMIHQKTGQVHRVCLNAEYSSLLPYFDFDSDMDPWTVARAFAKEPWSRQYFERIRQLVRFRLINFREHSILVNASLVLAGHIRIITSSWET